MAAGSRYGAVVGSRWTRTTYLRVNSAERQVPGCVAIGSTRKQVIDRIRHAFAMHLEGLIQDGLPLTAPVSSAEIWSASWRPALGLADHPGDDLAQVRAALAERHRVHPVREHHLRNLADVVDADLAGAVVGRFGLRRAGAD